MSKIKEKEIVMGHTFSEKGHVHMLDGKRLTGVTTILGVLDKPYLIPWASNMAVDYLKKNSTSFIKLEYSNEMSSEPISFETINWEAFNQACEVARTAWRTKRDSAGEKGKDIHTIVEEIIKNAIEFSEGYIKSGKNSSRQIQFFLDWAINNKVKFLASEKLVHSRELWIGGICDFVCEIDGKRIVGDIKTSKMIDPVNFWQTSAYDFCMNEMGEGLAENYRIIRLGKDEVDNEGKIIRQGTCEVGQNFAYDDNIEGFKCLLTVYRKLNAIGK